MRVISLLKIYCPSPQCQLLTFTAPQGSINCYVRKIIFTPIRLSARLVKITTSVEDMSIDTMVVLLQWC